MHMTPHRLLLVVSVVVAAAAILLGAVVSALRLSPIETTPPTGTGRPTREPRCGGPEKMSCPDGFVCVYDPPGGAPNARGVCAPVDVTIPPIEYER